MGDSTLPRAIAFPDDRDRDRPGRHVGVRRAFATSERTNAADRRRAIASFLALPGALAAAGTTGGHAAARATAALSAQDTADLGGVDPVLRVIYAAEDAMHADYRDDAMTEAEWLFQTAALGEVWRYLHRAAEGTPRPDRFDSFGAEVMRALHTLGSATDDWVEALTNQDPVRLAQGDDKTVQGAEILVDAIGSLDREARSIVRAGV